jgi:hypothetical protein
MDRRQFVAGAASGLALLAGCLGSGDPGTEPTAGRSAATTDALRKTVETPHTEPDGGTPRSATTRSGGTADATETAAGGRRQSEMTRSKRPAGTPQTAADSDFGQVRQTQMSASNRPDGTPSAMTDSDLRMATGTPDPESAQQEVFGAPDEPWFEEDPQVNETVVGRSQFGGRRGSSRWIFVWNDAPRTRTIRVRLVSPDGSNSSFVEREYDLAPNAYATLWLESHPDNYTIEAAADGDGFREAAVASDTALCVPVSTFVAVHENGTTEGKNWVSFC